MRDYCRERYDGSDGGRHACLRPRGHEHGHDAYPMQASYYCNLHGCKGEDRKRHMQGDTYVEVER